MLGKSRSRSRSENRGETSATGGIGRLDRGPGREPVDIRIIVSAAPARSARERASAYLPWPVRLVLRLGLPAFVLFMVFVLPNYLDCRTRHGSGQFFHGMTVAACTRQTVSGQIDETHKRFEDIARAIGAR